MASAVTDFAAEGLLDGLEGEARAARLALLERLGGEGRAAGGAARRGRRRAVGAAAGRARDRRRRRPLHRRASRRAAPASTSSCLLRFRAALGVPYGDPDERIGTEADLEAARRTKALLDAGFPAEDMLATRARSGWGWGGSPRPTASSSSAT